MLVRLWKELMISSVRLVVCLYRPFVAVTFLLVVRKPQAALYKLQLFVTSLLYIGLCQDKKKGKKLLVSSSSTKDECPSIQFSIARQAISTNTIDLVSSVTGSGDDGENINTTTSPKDILSTTTNQEQQEQSTTSTTTTTTFTTNLPIYSISRKTIIFVRHGESTWNDTFNRGDRKLSSFLIHFVPNLLYSIGTEYYFWITGQQTESWFYDSPLSEKGIQQALSIQKYLQTNPKYLLPKESKLLAILNNHPNNDNNNNSNNNHENNDKSILSSQLVSSNLRRAIATIAIGFQDRIIKSASNDIKTQQQPEKYEQDTILVLPCLQEISCNPDALCITPPHEPVVPAWTDPYPIVRHIYQNKHHHRSISASDNKCPTKSLIDTTLHTGNKKIFGNGQERLEEFCTVVFHTLAKKDAIIAGGHSLWFKEFFKLYLPRDFDHVSKKKKLINGGIVGFTLEQLEIKEQSQSGISSTKYHYMIDPTSIVVLHGGF